MCTSREVESRVRQLAGHSSPYARAPRNESSPSACWLLPALSCLTKLGSPHLCPPRIGSGATAKGQAFARHTQNNLMRLSPQLLLGCVRLTVKTNWLSIFLDNVARSEHDAKGRKDYLVLHTSDFLERGQLPGHTDCFDFFKRDSIKSPLHFTVQGSPRSLFGDSMVMCRSGEEPTVRPPLLGQGGGSERSECQWL